MSTPSAPPPHDPQDPKQPEQPEQPDDPPRRRFRSLPRAARWSAYAAVALVLVLVAGLVAGVLVVRQSFPQVEGEIEVPGLESEVTVLRDEHGIPHVYADSAEDLLFAQGYVQAQDRFFEMDFRRHVTAGRLSELFGETTLETDKNVRTMGWRRVAEEEIRLLDTRTLRWLEAYSAGVNAYIRSHSTAEMSLEYTLLGLTGLDYRVEDWTPVDSVAWLKAMAWDLRGNMDEEIDRALMSVRLTPEEIDQLYPPYPYDRHRPIVAGGGVVDGSFSQAGPPGPAARPAPAPEVAEALERLAASLDTMPELVGSGNGVGSNSWVVDGAHSTTGAPILANDPHLGVSLPGIWYQMGLHCTEVDEDCPFDVSGFTFSGVPGVVIGHNADIAWGFTNLGPDVTDLYIERIEGQSYLYDGELVPLEQRDEVIEVAGGDPFRFTVRSTRHGPLLSDVNDDLARVGANREAADGLDEESAGYGVALAWTALTPSRTADALFGLNLASDWDEFRVAAADFAVPSQNMVYADREGNIGYQAPGLVPIRRKGHDGNAPVEGWLPRNDWTGRFVPFEALPRVYNPAEGFIATANQAVTGPNYPYDLGDDWDQGYRSQRIVDVLTRRGTLSPDDMRELQLDDRNGFAPTLVPYLLDLQLDTPYYAAGQRLLRSWDFAQPAGSPAAAYYNAVWRQLLEKTFHDQLPEATWPDGGARWFEVVRGLLQQPASRWWDDVDTEDVREGRDDVLEAALRDARDELTRLQARRASEWTWGQEHVLDLENQSLGQSDIGLVRRLLNRGGYEVGGGDSIVNATGWTATEGYAVDWAPSMRMVVTLDDLDASTWINLTGVSGHAFHENYVDQTALWAEGGTLPWAFGREAVEAAAEDTLRLVPEAEEE